jgi:hypothetical protein
MASFDASVNPEANNFDSSSFIKKSFAGFVTVGSESALGTAPIITKISPPDMVLPNPDAPIVFSVLDSDSSLAAIFVWVKYRGLPITRLIFDGVSFTQEFSKSTRVSTTNGFIFTVYPGREGWLGPIEALSVRAVDATGLLDG